jgi:diadenosine tetraphosphate (Ap4A) HIT family hydrolase
MTMPDTACELCALPGGEVVYRSDKLRVVLVDDPDHPGFCRVIWNTHVKEMTDLPPADRSLLMQTVWQVEAALREVLQPVKVNLASLGNMVPHLHWHVIPRHADDAHFPAPVWAGTQRTTAIESLAARHASLAALRDAIVRHCQS